MVVDQYSDLDFDVIKPFHEIAPIQCLKPKLNSRCKSPNDDEKPSSFQPVMIKLNRGFTVYVYLQMIFSIQPEQFQI